MHSKQLYYNYLRINAIKALADHQSLCFSDSMTPVWTAGHQRHPQDKPDKAEQTCHHSSRNSPLCQGTNSTLRHLSAYSNTLLTTLQLHLSFCRVTSELHQRFE